MRAPQRVRSAGFQRDRELQQHALISSPALEGLRVSENIYGNRLNTHGPQRSQSDP